MALMTFLSGWFFSGSRTMENILIISSRSESLIVFIAFVHFGVIEIFFFVVAVVVLRHLVVVGV